MIDFPWKIQYKSSTYLGRVVNAWNPALEATSLLMAWNCPSRSSAVMVLWSPAKKHRSQCINLYNKYCWSLRVWPIKYTNCKSYVYSCTEQYPSCCFSLGITLKLDCFLAWGFMFVLLSLFPKVKNGSVFPAFCHASSTMLWSRAVMYPERGKIVHIYRDRNRFDFMSRPCDQESTNGSACLV